MAELVGEIATTLGVGDRVRPHVSDITERYARMHQQVEADVHHHLALDQQLFASNAKVSSVALTDPSIMFSIAANP